jgi:hypothetical protein
MSAISLTDTLCIFISANCQFVEVVLSITCLLARFIKDSLGQMYGFYDVSSTAIRLLFLHVEIQHLAFLIRGDSFTAGDTAGEIDINASHEGTISDTACEK